MMRNTPIRLLLAVLLITDLAVSFHQYYHQPFDGDLVLIAAPAEHYATVLTSPFGGEAIFRGKNYAGSNRHFAHRTMYEYFRMAPLVFQRFFSPVTSLYVSAACIKLLAQLLILSGLSAWVVGHFRWWRTEFLAIAVFLTPFFQTNGNAYYPNMGIIDHAVTYVFFYALPLGVLLLVAFPFRRAFVRRGRFGWSVLELLGMTAGIVYLAFSGPLLPPLLLLAIGWIFLANGYQNRRNLIAGNWKKWKPLPFSASVWFVITFALIGSGYSQILAGYNLENQSAPSIALLAAVARMGEGLFFILTSKLGIPLVLVPLVGLLQLHKKRLPNRSVLRRNLCWLALFLLSYLVLLPLGGVRDYRPNLLRYDTFLPVTLGLLFALAALSYALWQHLPTRGRLYLGSGLGLLFLIFTLADGFGKSENTCERETLERIRASAAVQFHLPECRVFSWNTQPNPELQEHLSEMLVRWNIRTERVTLHR